MRGMNVPNFMGKSSLRFLVHDCMNMTSLKIHRIVAVGLMIGSMIASGGCSSLGLSLFPTGHFLTKQSEAILACSPRSADIPRELSMGVEPVHYLQPGDVLLIEPVELTSDVRIPADQKVLTDGTIDLGKYGRVVLAGMTIENAESFIEQTIKDTGEEATAINVRLLDPIHRYYVLGEVNSPGSYPLEGHESVLDGILAAGGLTSAAAPCKILLARPTSPESCRVTLQVCYREITQMGDTTTNYQLKPGDRIFVATRSCAEDLMFWQATKTCERCCKCQTACLDPNAVPTFNPMSRVVPTVYRSRPNDSNKDSEEVGTQSVDPSFGELIEGTDASVPLSPSGSVPSTGTLRLPNPQSTGAKPIVAPSTPGRAGEIESGDGELDFNNSKPIQRFEPMWIKPSGG